MEMDDTDVRDAEIPSVALGVSLSPTVTLHIDGSASFDDANQHDIRSVTLDQLNAMQDVTKMRE